MDITKTQSSLTVGKKIWRWYLLGKVSNKTPAGISVGIHLHFTVRKYVNGTWLLVDPYGQWLSGKEVEPYLWE